MSLIVSGVSTANALEFAKAVKDPNNFFSMWFSAWLTSWAVAFPVVLVIAPFVNRVVDGLFPRKYLEKTGISCKKY
jgi:hypothetical protein